MFKVVTNYPLATKSLDYLYPLGNLNDNTKYLPFNRKIEELFAKKPIKIIDLGCAGGGLIEDFVHDGHLAIGLDGCDASYNISRAAWSSIPNNLFLCDCAKPFQIYYNDIRFEADVITSFEFFEHIKWYDLSRVTDNIINHLSPSGITVHSIALFESSHHETVQTKEWWIEFFRNQGLYIREDLMSIFQKSQWVHHDQPGKRLYLIMSKEYQYYIGEHI